VFACGGNYAETAFYDPLATVRTEGRRKGKETGPEVFGGRIYAASMVVQKRGGEPGSPCRVKKNPASRGREKGI